MKSVIRGAAVSLAVLLSAQVAQAQAVSLGLGGGVVLPSGDFGNGLKNGWSGTAQLRMKPPASPLGVQVDAFYTQFGFDAVDGHARMIGGTADAVFGMSSASLLKPYLIGGVGVYNSQATVAGVSGDSQTKFGVNAGAGFDFGVGPAQLFLEGRFHAISKGTVDPVTAQEKTAYMIPLTVGIRF